MSSGLGRGRRRGRAGGRQDYRHLRTRAQPWYSLPPYHRCPWRCELHAVLTV